MDVKVGGQMPVWSWHGVMRWLGPLLGLVVFIIAGFALHDMLSQFSYQEIRQAFREIPTLHILLAVFLTALDYMVLTLYDVLAFRYAGVSMPYRRKAFASFIAYSFSNTAGHSYLSGGSVRYRLYMAWGVPDERIARIIAFCVATDWLAFASTGAVALLSVPADDLPAAYQLPFRLPLGLLLASAVLAYVFFCFTERRAVKIRKMEFQLPGGGLALAQIAAGAVDLTVAASVLYMLMVFTVPVGFATFLGLFIMAILTGIISRVPGGLGVFDAVMALMLQPFASVPSIVSSILLFRVLYYFLPLVIGVLMLSGYEAAQRRAQLARASAVLRALSPVAPDVLALLIVLGGVVLLVSGATPPEHGRMETLREFVPLPMVEASHFMASVVGVMLVLVGRAIQRRVDAAYWLAMCLLYAGIIFSLLKGIDYEEAAVLAVVLIALAPWRGQFYRRGSLLAPRLGVGWVAAILAILLSVCWLAYFSHRHVEYSSRLWWQFTFDTSAPRVLRATVATGVVAVIFSLAHLLRPAAAKIAPPDPVVGPEIERLAVHSERTYSYLALLGDKRFLLNKDATGFIMYNVADPCAVAMGDPIGAPETMPELAWGFLELCDRLGTMPVFYEVAPEYLHVYADLGLMAVKFGEEALVDLGTFSMDGASHKSARHVLNKLEREGVELVIEPRERVPELMPELKAVSDDWLRHKNTREKGFSLGFFDETYLVRFRHAVLRQSGKMLAFANLLESAGRHELSIDLMRHLEESPGGTMDFMFYKLMMWGREQGFQQFNLGLAPLSGIESRRLSPLWNRVATLTFHHAERFYNLQGLRQYKEKFDPAWQPRYIAVPERVTALPRALRSVATLVNRGLTGVIAR